MPHYRKPPLPQQQPPQFPGVPNPMQPFDPAGMQPMPGMPGMPPAGGPPPGPMQPQPPQPPQLGAGGPPEPEDEDAIDPEVLKALVERNLLDEETAEFLLAEKRGAAMAYDTPSPEGTRTPGPFGTYVAANPLEHLAAALQRFKGQRGMSDAQKRLEALRRRKAAFDSRIMNFAASEDE